MDQDRVAADVQDLMREYGCRCEECLSSLRTHLTTLLTRLRAAEEVCDKAGKLLDMLILTHDYIDAERELSKAHADYARFRQHDKEQGNG